MRNNRAVASTEVEEACVHSYEFVSFIDDVVVERCTLCGEEREIEL